MVKHTMSMYATKDEMIEAMQAEIDSLEAQLEASEFHRSNNLIEISELCAKLAEARKDSERLDFIIGDDETDYTVAKIYAKNKKYGVFLYDQCKMCGKNDEIDERDLS